MLDVIPLSRPLSLFEGYPATEIMRRDIPRLRDTPILDWDGKPLALELRNSADDPCEVHTVNQLQEKLADGFYAATTLAMRLQGGYFDVARSVLDAAQLAAKPTVSFLDNPYVSVGNIDLIPSRLVARSFGEGGIAQHPPSDSTTLAQLIEEGSCIIEQHEKDRIRFQVGVHIGEHEKDNVGFQMGVHCFARELLRADLNGDGFQDILLHQAFQVISGTLTWFESNILTRKSSTSLLERVPLSFI